MQHESRQSCGCFTISKDTVSTNVTAELKAVKISVRREEEGERKKEEGGEKGEEGKGEGRGRVSVSQQTDCV